MKMFLISGSYSYAYLSLNVKPCSTDSDDLPATCTSEPFQVNILQELGSALTLAGWTGGDGFYCTDDAFATVPTNSFVTKRFTQPPQLVEGKYLLIYPWFIFFKEIPLNLFPSHFYQQCSQFKAL